MSDTTSNHLANERTFLAWMRTSFSIIVFGFVVARFGVALHEFFLLQHHKMSSSDDSLALGVTCMVVGIVFAVIALLRYQMTRIQIEAGQFKPAYLTTLFLGFFTASVGVGLVFYLIYAAHNL